jgi:hypothetical protein
MLRFAQENGLKTALVNASWSCMAEEHGAILRGLDIIVVREPQSAARIEALTGKRPQVFADLSLQHPLSHARNLRRKGFLITDFYSHQFGAFMAIKGGAMSRERQLDMRRTDWRRTLREVSKAEVLITGRFHGLCAALATRTPFVAWPGNTDKIEAFLSWIGADSCLAKSPSEFLELASCWRDRKKLYDSVFDRVASAERWRLSFGKIEKPLAG